MARFTLTPGPIDVDVFGWELKGLDTYLTECHETFSDSPERDLALAKRWANEVIGSRHVWREVVEQRGSYEFTHYEAGRYEDTDNDWD
jgi:hypothetical protein